MSNSVVVASAGQGVMVTNDQTGRTNLVPGVVLIDPVTGLPYAGGGGGGGSVGLRGLREGGRHAHGGLLIRRDHGAARQHGSGQQAGQGFEGACDHGHLASHQAWAAGWAVAGATGGLLLNSLRTIT